MSLSRRGFAAMAVGAAAASTVARAMPGAGAEGAANGATATGKGVYVPARWIAAPSTISDHARALLANPPKFNGSAPPKDTADKAAWRAYTAAGNAMLTNRMAGNVQEYPTDIVPLKLSGATLYELVPASLDPGHKDRAIYYLHGGGYTIGGGMAAAYMGMPVASAHRMRTFSLDYRMPPDHPFPAAIDDAVEGYRMLLKRYRADQIAIAGGSAGGGLAAALVLKIRDLGLPMPGCCVLSTPETDLTESGDTFSTNDTIDVILPHRLTDSIALYADGHDLRDPYLSPIFGDFSKGFVPTILFSGTRDLFLSNTVLFHRAVRRAGIAAELHIFEAMPHGGFFGAPEDKEAKAEEVRFVAERLGLDARRG